MRANPGLEQLGLVGRRDHHLGPRLRLQAVRHDFPPKLLDQLRRGAVRPGLEALEDLGLAPRPHLEVAVTDGVFDGGDVGRRSKPLLDEIEDLIVDTIEFDPQRGEPLQLILGHSLSRFYRFEVAAELRGRSIRKSPAALRRTGP